MACPPAASQLLSPSQAQCGHIDPPQDGLSQRSPRPSPTLSSSFFARKKSSTKPLSPEISSEVTCEEGHEKPVGRGASQPPLPTCRGVGAGGGTHCDGGLAGGFPVLEKERLAHPLLSHDLQGGAERWAGGSLLGVAGLGPPPFPAAAARS